MQIDTYLDGGGAIADLWSADALPGQGGACADDGGCSNKSRHGSVEQFLPQLVRRPMAQFLLCCCTSLVELGWDWPSPVQGICLRYWDCDAMK
jgi:hypothetical protein